MIELQSLTKDYSGNVVVDDVSFVVPDGDIATIVGTSGSGKTTLLRMINRLIDPTSGRVLVDGEDVSQTPAYELRRRIGYVIQGYGLFPHRTVAQNIATVPQLVGWDRARIDSRVDELLELFQLEPAAFRDRLPIELSGGQQQRVGVARALAAEPKLLLMDEPFGALDPIIRLKAQDDLLAIHRRFKTTIVLVTHDMEEAIRLSDHIAVMDAGKLLQFSPPADIIGRPATPFVAELTGSAERPFRLLSLAEVGEIAEPGEGEGEPVSATMSLRDAYAECLWTGRHALSVEDETGKHLGRVTLGTLGEHARRPA